MSESAPPATPSPDDAKKRLRDKVDKLLAREPCKSQGSIALNGRTLKYSAVAAFIPVTAGGVDDKRDEPEAAVFTTSYFLDGAPPGTRPVCFVFNGGPGSASIWLHLGALGPKRVVIREDGSMPPPPYTVTDNQESWFEHFDLVFIDPPHTGYSITASEEARKKMLSVDGDVDALAECMRAWLGRHRRWSSPVYLAGESYGTTRGAALAEKLLDIGVALSGLILVSCAMDLQSLVFAPRNDLPYALFLPAFASVAQFHGKLSGRLAESPAAARAAAEEFVTEEYLAALHAGARLSKTARRRLGKRVAELTGLAPALVDEKNLRISDQTFFFELLRDRGLIVGRLEARVTGPMAASRSRDWEFDPGIEAIAAPYTMAAHAYMSEQLGVDTQTRYEVLSMDAHKHWNWNRREDKGNNFACTSPDLSRALRRNPHLRVLVASGHYDLGTPYSRERLVARPARRAAGGARPRPAPLLWRRPHDVHARGRHAETEARSRGLAGGVKSPGDHLRCRGCGTARRMGASVNDTVKYVLEEARIPKVWYNLQADLPRPLPPVLHPGTQKPVSPDDLAPLFPMELILQEVTTEREIDIPGPVRDVYRQWRPTPLYRARRLERALQTPARIYYKYEGVSPAGSHKPNTAVAQAFYNQQAGVKKLVTETGAGQWGSSLAFAGALFGIDVQVFMVRVSYDQKPYRRALMETYGARCLASPSAETQSGRAILAQRADHPGSLGIAISEAVEVAVQRDDTKYALGSVLNHVLLHQTVIGQEALLQLEMADDYPDVIVGCTGGGSNFAGIAFPFIGAQLRGGRKVEVIAVEPAACPSLTRGTYAYDFGDTAHLTPLTKMHTLGSTFTPPGFHAGGLRYHGMAPLVSHLKQLGLISAVAYHQSTVFDAGVQFARAEGILPAPEANHAVKGAIDAAIRCREEGRSRAILFNLCGHGHFDMQAYIDYFAGKLQDLDYDEAELAMALAGLPSVREAA